MTIELVALRKVALFESLVPEHVRLIGSIVTEQQVPPSTKLFGDGDKPDRFYFIVQGKVRISKQIPGIGEEALAVLELRSGLAVKGDDPLPRFGSLSFAPFDRLACSGRSCDLDRRLARRCTPIALDHDSTQYG